MRIAELLLAAAGILVLAGCGASGIAQGGGSEYGNYGQVKVGVPF